MEEEKKSRASTTCESESESEGKIGSTSIRRKHSVWGKSEVNEFYNMLSFFGTDFSLMSSFFKTKTIS